MAKTDIQFYYVEGHPDWLGIKLCEDGVGEFVDRDVLEGILDEAIDNNDNVFIDKFIRHLVAVKKRDLKRQINCQKVFEDSCISNKIMKPLIGSNKKE